MTEDSAFTPQPRACWIAGAAEQGSQTVTVTHPYDGSEVADVAVPSAEQVHRALAAAAEGRLTRTRAADRAAALDHVAAGITARAEEFAETITAESGKPLRWAEVEVEHAATNCRLAAEQTRRFADEPRLLDAEERGADRLALARRVPRGPVLAVTSSAFPLNLVAHEVAAAIAVGAPIVVKPATATPLSALLLGEILATAGLPAGAFSVLPVPGAQSHEWLTDERIEVVSFTGSASVGRSLGDWLVGKHVLSALGPRSAAIVAHDWTRDSDVDFAAARIARYACYQAGQSPLAVRRAVLHADVADRCTERIVASVAALRTGNPFDPEVEVGPLVHEANAASVLARIDEAVASGAVLLHGGKRDGNTIEPTVLADVPSDAALCREEVFAPVLVLSTVDSVEEAFDEVNRMGYLGPAGLFSHEVRGALVAGPALAGAGVTVGELPAHRADALLFDTARGAGAGRKVLRSTMHELTTEQITVLPVG